MRAMLLRAQAPIGTAPLGATEVPTHDPGPGELRVRVRACATCRTDLHVIEGDLAPRRLPLIPGHQAVGEVEALGTRALRFGRGDSVGIAWLRQTCGTCRFCVTGRENLCEASAYTGWTDDGGYAEQALVPEAFAYPIPRGFDDAEATPLLCAGIIGYRTLLRSQVPRAGRLALYGFGSSAHVTLQIARHWGCTVYVATRNSAHQRLALELGAAWAGTPKPPHVTADTWHTLQAQIQHNPPQQEHLPLSQFGSAYCQPTFISSHLWLFALGWALVALLLGFWYFWRKEVNYGRG